MKNTWHKVRNFQKKKTADGAVTKSSTPGMTLKSWAKHQIETSGPHAEECSQWLKNKKTLRIQGLDDLIVGVFFTIPGRVGGRLRFWHQHHMLSLHG